MLNINFAAKAVCNVLTVIGGAVAVYSYGKMNYYQGRLDAAIELKDAMENLVKEFEDKHKSEEEEA